MHILGSSAYEYTYRPFTSLEEIRITKVEKQTEETHTIGYSLRVSGNDKHSEAQGREAQTVEEGAKILHVLEIIINRSPHLTDMSNDFLTKPSRNSRILSKHVNRKHQCVGTLYEYQKLPK